MSAKKKLVSHQQMLFEPIQKCDKLPPESNKAKLITEKVVDFVVLDDEALSIVENVGFCHLMKHLEPRYVLPYQHFISETAIPHK